MDDDCSDDSDPTDELDDVDDSHDSVHGKELELSLEDSLELLVELDDSEELLELDSSDELVELLDELEEELKQCAGKL